MSDDLRIPPSGHRPGGRDQETRRLVVMAGAIGVVILLVVIMWGVFSGGGGSVPLVEALPGPVKVKPTDPGGLQIATMNNQLLGASGASGTALAPAPEAPDPAALAAAAAQDQAAATPATPAPSATAPAADAPPAPAATDDASTLPLPPAPASDVPVVPERPMTGTTRNLAKATPQPRNAAGVGNLAMEVPQVAPTSSGLSAPREARPGHVQVQLAALDTAPRAQAEWVRLARHMPGLLGSHQPIVTHAEVGGRSFWRLRTAGFASVAEATHFCADIRAQGANCTVAAF
jgi:hypothetical protein